MSRGTGSSLALRGPRQASKHFRCANTAASAVCGASRCPGALVWAGAHLCIDCTRSVHCLPATGRERMADSMTKPSTTGVMEVALSPESTTTPVKLLRAEDRKASPAASPCRRDDDRRWGRR